nr:6K2 protein [Sweet potato virus 2]
SAEAMAKHLKLKGIWSKSIMTQDLLDQAGVFIGGIWMTMQGAKDTFDETVRHQ